METFIVNTHTFFILCFPLCIITKKYSHRIVAILKIYKSNTLPLLLYIFHKAYRIAPIAIIIVLRVQTCYFTGFLAFQKNVSHTQYHKGTKFQPNSNHRNQHHEQKFLLYNLLQEEKRNPHVPTLTNRKYLYH